MYRATVYFDDMYARSTGGKTATLDAKRYIVLSELYSITKYFYLIKLFFWKDL